jgi:hypothetical protein
MAAVRVTCWEAKDVYTGFSWHSEVSDLVESALPIFSEAEHNKKSSVNWKCAQFLSNGIFLQWKTPVKFQAGYFYYYRLLHHLKKEGTKLRGWYVVGHKGAFSWDAVSASMSTRQQLGDAPVAIVQIPAPIAEPVLRRRIRTKTPAKLIAKPEHGALVAGMRTALTPVAIQEQDTACSTRLTMNEAGIQAKECLVLAMMKGHENLQLRASAYSCQEKLGEGSFGSVFRGTSGPFILAVKRLKGADLQEAMAEAYVLERCTGHPNIVQLLDVYAQHADGRMRIHLVLKLSGADLELIIHRGGVLKPQEIRLAVSDVRTALDYLHSSVHVIHCDVKPGNILGDDVKEASGRLRCYKLADLGSCVEKDPAARTQQVCTVHGIKLQTLPYRAYEVMCGDLGFSQSIDSWSLGIVLAELAGHVFTITASSSVPQTMKRIEEKLGTPSCVSLQALPGYKIEGGYPKGKWPTHLHQALGPEGVDLLECLLEYDKNERTAFHHV